MNGFSTLMFISSISLLLVGLYLFTGHKLDMLSWKPAYKNLKKSDWKKIGKYTMIVRIFIFILAIVILIFDIK